MICFCKKNIMLLHSRQAFNSVLAIACLFFAFFWLPVPRLFNLACILFILFFVPAPLHRSNTLLRKDPLIKLAVLFFLYIIFSIIWHRLTLPDHFPPTTSDRRFLTVLYFIGIAYSIKFNRFLNPWHLLAISFLGLLAYLATNFNINEWRQAWLGARVDFGIHNAQHTGVIFATCFLGFGILGPRFYTWSAALPVALRLLGRFLWLAAFLFASWGTLVSQTRAVWLALSITLLVSPVIILLIYKLSPLPRPSVKKLFLTGLAGIALLSGLTMSFDPADLVSERITRENITWERLRQAAKHEKTNLSSAEVRVASWSAATDWIMEKPLMGWGGRGSRPLIRNSDLFSESFKRQFNHLHNSYLQVLVEIGFIGAAFITALIIIFGKATIKSYQRKTIPLDALLFTWAFFVFWAVVNIFESYIIYETGIYLVAIVAGFAYSFCLESATIQKTDAISFNNANL